LFVVADLELVLWALLSSSRFIAAAGGRFRHTESRRLSSLSAKLDSLLIRLLTLFSRCRSRRRFTGHATVVVVAVDESPDATVVDAVTNANSSSGAPASSGVVERGGCGGCCRRRTTLLAATVVATVALSCATVALSCASLV